MKNVDLDKAAEILRALGYDVVMGDGEVSARKDDAVGVRALYIDGSGRVRVVATRMGDIPKGRRVKQNGKEFRVLEEVQETTTVMTEVCRAEELLSALKEVDQILTQNGDEPGAPSKN